MMSLRRALQLNAEAIQPSSAVLDAVIETDEMFQSVSVRSPGVAACISGGEVPVHL